MCIIVGFAHKVHVDSNTQEVRAEPCILIDLTFKNKTINSSTIVHLEILYIDILYTEFLYHIHI